MNKCDNCKRFAEIRIKVPIRDDDFITYSGTGYGNCFYVKGITFSKELSHCPFNSFEPK